MDIWGRKRKEENLVHDVGKKKKKTMPVIVFIFRRVRPAV